MRTSVRTLSRLGTEGECSDALVILGVCSELRCSNGGSLHASGYRLQAQACGIDWVLVMSLQSEPCKKFPLKVRSRCQSAASTTFAEQSGQQLCSQNRL